MKYSILSNSEQNSLLQDHFNNKNNHTRDMIFNHNMRLVGHVLKSFSFNESSREDLFQEGCIGLLKTIEKFNPNRGVTFSTYATFWIRAYIIRFIMDKMPLTKTCTTQKKRKLFFTLAKERAKLSASNPNISNQDLAKHLDVDLKDIEQISNRNTPYKELDDNSTEELSSSKMIEANLAKNKYLSLCKKFKKSLKKNEKIVFERRVEKPMFDTLENIGTDLNVTRQRVKQIEDKILTLFRKRLASNKIFREDMEMIMEVM